MAATDNYLSNGKTEVDDESQSPPPPKAEAVLERKGSKVSAGRRRSSNLLDLTRRNDTRDDGKVELTEQDAWEVTGFAFPTWKKWLVLSVIFAVQSSMNVCLPQNLYI